MKPLLSVIIVSYNTKKLTLETIASAIESLSKLPNLAYEILVVDNNSSDDSVSAIKEQFGRKVRVIVRDSNGGFAVANNVGIRASSGKYIILLNSDTLVQGNALEEMMRVMEMHKEIGVLSCRLVHKDGSFQPQGGALPTLLSVAAWWLWPLPGIIPGVAPYQNPSDPLQDTPAGAISYRGWVGGTAMMIRRSLLKKVGLLDEKIFMYAEDVDFCLRVYKAGHNVAIATECSITHYGSASGHSHHALLGEVKGLIYLFTKHCSVFSATMIRMILCTGGILRYLLFGILKRNPQARELYGSIVRSALFRL